MEVTKKKRRSLYLVLLMVFAMLMGPGPGLRFVNPDIEDPAAQFSIGGVPIIYLWGLFWFVIQVAIIIVAYMTVWNESDEVIG